jgi:hypothetical protein
MLIRVLFRREEGEEGRRGGGGGGGHFIFTKQLYNLQSRI